MNQQLLRATAVIVFSMIVALAPAKATEPTAMNGVAGIGEAYAHLVLAMGQHDPDYVDAFYGPPEWKKKAEEEKKPLTTIREEAMALFERLSDLPVPEE